MGIRVHKILGYGLPDIQFEKEGYRITDPRLSKVAKTHNWWRDHRTCYDLDGYAEFCRAQDERRGSMHAAFLKFWLDGERKKFDLSRSITLDVEYGLPILLVTPPEWLSSWFRYDDTIDWVEETYTKPDRQGNWVKVLRDGIYPNNALIMDRTAPLERVDWDHHRAILWAEDALEREPDPDKQATLRSAVTALITSQGYDPDTYHDRIVPRVPEAIEDICLWLGIFNDPDTIWDLRPMIYCYWA